MKNEYFQASISGIFLLFLLVFFLGFILGITLIKSWGFSTGNLTAFIVATATLVATIKNFSEQRKHNRLSVTPYLQIDTKFEIDNKMGLYKYEISLNNFGLGPAIIISKEFYFDNHLCKNTNDEIYKWYTLCHKHLKTSVKCHNEIISKNDAVDKNQTLPILYLEFPINSLNANAAKIICDSISEDIIFKNKV